MSYTIRRNGKIMSLRHLLVLVGVLTVVAGAARAETIKVGAVSYTHLTLPTIYSV